MTRLSQELTSNTRWSGRAMNKVLNLSQCSACAMMRCRAAQLHR